MATTWFGEPHPEATEPAASVARDAEFSTDAAPASPSDDPGLALDDMKLAIDDGLLMVFGPEGDPVPPQAFADAAAAHPDRLLRLPDGKAAPASRIAAALGAQTRLGAAEQSADWIFMMIREGGGPELASEDALRAEQGSCALIATGSELIIVAEANRIRVVDVAPGPVARDAMGLFVDDGTPISVANLIGRMRKQQSPGLVADAEAGAKANAGADPRIDQHARGEGLHVHRLGSEDLVLRGCTIEVRGDGIWLAMPGAVWPAGGVSLARWATNAPKGPMVNAILPGGRVASVADLINLGLAAGHHVEFGRQATHGALGQSSAGEVAAADAAQPSEDSGPSEDSSGSDEHSVDDWWHASDSSDSLDQMAQDGIAVIEPSVELPPSEPEVDDARLDAITTEPDLAAARSGFEPADVELSDEPGDLGDPPLPSPVTEFEADVGHGIEPERSPDPALSIPVVPEAPSCDVNVAADHPALHSINHARAGGRPTDQVSCGEGVAGKAIEARDDRDGADAAPLLGIAAEQAGAEHVEVDPESIVLVVIRGVPEGARLSAGVPNEDGSWLLSPLDLPTVTISLPSAGRAGEAQRGDGDLTITGMALAEDGALAAICETVPIADYLADPGPGVQTLSGAEVRPADNAGATGPRRIPLEVEPLVRTQDRIDALVIRDLPAGARLSAGAYDAAIDGWVLMPHDMSGLAILPPADLRDDFTVTLLGVALRPGDANAVRVLGRLPVRPA